MLRFLRQIRQRLLAENRFSKYLLYAIGEIILVVIGILLALQIDNWNDERKDRDRERAYIKSFLVDLEKNRRELLLFIDDGREIFDGIGNILDMQELDMTLSANADSLHLKFKRNVRLRTLPYVDRTLNQLESTGDFILLKSAVADSISTYKLYVDRAQQQEDGCKNTFRELRAFSNSYLYMNLMRPGFTKYISANDVLTGTPFPPLPESPILKNELFNLLAGYRGCMGYYYFERITPLLEYTGGLIHYLKKEY